MIAVGPTSAAIPLDQLPLQGLARAIASNQPLMVQAEGATGSIYYRWSQASGIVNEAAVSTTTGTANQVCGSKLVTEPPIVGELAPSNTTHLVAKVAAGQPTGLLRIWLPG